jgi:predicted NUDIX family NTP pyrophosphohydrolase
MPIRSAGLLIYRRRQGLVQVLLVHPGGPFWAKKDDGAWSIPKGLVDENEDELAAAQREAEEELGVAVGGRFEHLGSYRQPGGKIVVAWCVESDVDTDAVSSNTFVMEWPPRSGSMKEFPEVDKAGWFSLPQADVKILKGQRAILTDFAERHDAG